MAYIDNSETKKEINDAIRGNAVSNLAPTKVNDSVQPVININPKDYRRCNIVKVGSATNANATIYTTPTDKDFYLVGACISRIKDAASDETFSSIALTIDGDTSSTNILRLSGITLTADSKELSSDFTCPIRLKRGSTITLARTASTAGVLTYSATIWGYTVEP